MPHFSQLWGEADESMGHSIVAEGGQGQIDETRWLPVVANAEVFPTLW